ncbi:9291_t:CDS:2, partial [Entrophospora sp. SA101]
CNIPMIDDDDAINEITIATDGIKNITKIQLPLNAVEIMADLSFETLKSWNLPKFHLQILTQSRPNSFSRLLESLDSSIYFGDEIPLTINMNSSGWFVAKAYYPYSNHDHTVLLEDDIEIITLLLYLVKYIALKYIYELPLPGRKKFYPEQVFDNTRYDVRSPYLCQDDNNNYKVQSIRIPYSRFNNWKNSWKHIAEYDDTYIHFREGKHDPLSILMVPLMAENVIFKELPGGALADYNDLPRTDAVEIKMGPRKFIDIFMNLMNKTREARNQLLLQLQLPKDQLMCQEQEQDQLMYQNQNQDQLIDQNQGKQEPQTLRILGNVLI